MLATTQSSPSSPGASSWAAIAPSTNSARKLTCGCSRSDSACPFGLAAVKNVGLNAIQSIVAGRKQLGRYSSIYEFCEKVDLRLLNKRVLESLIKSGAMDGLGRRAQLMAVLDRGIEGAQKTQRDTESGQHGLFGVFQEEVHTNDDKLPDTPDWDEHVRLANE